jgi:hypothetical protein
VSLLTGSVLILLTLYMPTAVDSCGAPESGAKLASGAQGVGWVGTTLDFPANGRALYPFCLALAGFALLFVFASLLRRSLARKRGLLTWLLALASGVALLPTTDLFFEGSGCRFATVLGLVTLAIMAFLFPAACFRPGFWTKKGVAFWALVAAGILFGLWLGRDLFSKFYPQGGSKFDLLVFYLIASLFALLPLGLWFRYGSFGSSPRPIWPDVGRRLVIFYGIAAAYDLVTVALYEIWGLIAFLAGAYLIFFGYQWLQHEADAREAESETRNYDTRETVTPRVVGDSPVWLGW